MRLELLYELVPAVEHWDLLEEHEAAKLSEHLNEITAEAIGVYGDEPLGLTLSIEDVGTCNDATADTTTSWTLTPESALAYIMKDLGGEVQADGV